MSSAESPRQALPHRASSCAGSPPRGSWLAFSVLAALSCIVRQPPSKTASQGAGDRVAPTIASRFARLTHSEWANTVRDLFQLESRPEALATLRPDPKMGGSPFANHAAALQVDEALWRDYQRAVMEIAERATASGAELVRIAPGEHLPERERAQAFIRDFGARAHRRPLAEGERAAYLELFEAEAKRDPTGEAFAAGVRGVLEAMLASPHFLYRVELGTATRDGKLWLGAHELASRLSYAIWDSMPDAPLFDAAQSGALEDPAKLAAEARRLLEDGRARAALSEFHAELFERDRVRHVAPAPGRFASISPDFGAAAARENELFFEHQIFELDAGYRELLTSSRSFVNAELAAVYGLAGDFGEEFVPVELDPARRRGFLTQTAFLAAHATSLDPDPIHRGVFVARRLLCLDLVAPGNLPPLPPRGGRTNRQTVEAHTEREGSGCAVCHRRTINPLGFPFEMFDAVGGFRSEDGGIPVDTRSEVRIDGRALPVADALELVNALAESPAAHTCYVRHLLEFLYARPVTARDDALASDLGERSAEGELSVKELVVALTSAPEFRSIDLRDL